ncbi:MAG: hypothetical protein Q7K44_00560 [Candidatus Liptonbacteria bacterium]|nr:hypothetical protein [Candidatus Liptonbacteria bacterium]
MTAVKKTIIITVSLFCVAVVVSAVAFFYVLKVLPSKNVAVDVSQANSDWAMREYEFLIPKSKASPVYAEAFNLTVNEVSVLDSTNLTPLFPLISKFNDALVAKNYDAINSLSLQIRDLNETEKKREVILAKYLKNFGAVNGNIGGVTDKETIQLTADFISTATKVNDAYIAYSAMIDGMISGKMTDQSVNDAKNTMENLRGSKVNYMNASKKLVAFFTVTLKSDITKGNATSTKK